MDSTMTSWLQAIAAYSLPPIERQDDNPPPPQYEDPPSVPAENLMRQVQILMSENSHLRDSLHSRSGGCSPGARSASPIAEPKKATNGRTPSDLSEMCFLQNQVGFLRAALGQVHSPLPSQPVFLVQGEFFLLLRKALNSSLETISLFLGNLNNQEESLFQTYADLQNRVQTYSQKYTFDTSLFYQLMVLVEESEGFKQQLLSVLKVKMQGLSSDLTKLIYASFQMVMPLAISLKDEADINELRTWNERKIEISTEEGTFELLSCKQKMLLDLEALKISLLERNFNRQTSIPSPIPRAPAACRFKPRSLPDTPPSEPQQMLPYLSSEANFLLIALNEAKEVVGTWPWRRSPLLPSQRRDCRNLHELGAVIKAAKVEVDEIAKVAKADKPEIVAKVLQTLKEESLETSNVSLETSVRDAQEEIERNHIEKAELLAEIERLNSSLEGEKATNGQLQQSYQSLESQYSSVSNTNEQLQQELSLLHSTHQDHISQCSLSLSTLQLEVTHLTTALTSYQALYQDLQTQIAAFIDRANGRVFHSTANCLGEIAEEIEALNRKYEESIETVVMESFEPKVLRVVNGIKLRFSEGEAEAVWKGMQYLVDAGDRTAKVAGCEPGPRETTVDMTSTVMKTMQHYVFEDLQLIEDRVIEMLIALQALQEEKEGLQGTLEAAGQRESQVEWSKNEQIAVLAQELEIVRGELEAERQANSFNVSNLSYELDCLRKQASELERDSQILRKELQYHEIPVYSSSLQDLSDEVSKGAGGNIAQSLSKGLDYTISFLAREVLKRDINPPVELMQKQAVLYSLARDIQREFEQKEAGMQGDIEDLRYQILRVTDEKNGVIQVNLALRGELEMARKGNKSLLIEKFDLEDAHTEAMKKLNQELAAQKDLTNTKTIEIARLTALLQQLEFDKKTLEDKLAAEHSTTVSQSLDIQRLHDFVHLLESEKEQLRITAEREAERLRELLNAEAVVISVEEKAYTSGDLEGGTRLQTAGSIEEKLLTGFEYICTRAKNITQNTASLPKEHLDKQKYLYDRLEDIENIIMELRGKLAAKEAQCVIHTQELAQLHDQLSQSSDENRRNAKEIDMLNTNISGLKADLDQAIAEIASKSAALTDKTTESNSLYQALQECKQNCTRHESHIALLKAEIESIKQSSEAEKKKMRDDFETERHSTSQEVENRQRKQIQALDDQIATIRLEKEGLNREIEKEKNEHKQDSERLAAKESQCALQAQQLAQLHDQLSQSSDENRRYSKEIEMLNTNISRLKADLDQAVADIASKSAALTDKTAEVNTLNQSLQDCKQNCAQHERQIAKLEAEIETLKQTFEAEKKKMQEDFETEKQSTAQEAENKQRQQAQSFEDQIAAVRAEKEGLSKDIDIEKAEHKQDRERLTTDLERERKDKESITAKLKQTEAEAAKAQKDSSDHLHKLTEDTNREISGNKALIDQLRKRLAEVESLVYVTPIQAIEEPDTPRQRERKTAYLRKVNKGFEYLNGKLAIMAPKEDPVANSMLENQMQMYKQLLDVERLLRVSKEEKDKANDEQVAAMRKIDRLNQEMQKLLEEKAQTFRDHSSETGQLKGKVTTLEDEVKSLKDKLWKATKSDESSKAQLIAAKQTIEDLKRENANLRSQLGTDYTIAYPSEGGSPVSDETPRRQLQSQGSIESRLDKGFDVILKVTQATTGHSYANISNLLDKQKAVYDEVMALTSAKSAVSQETSMLLTTCNDDLAKAREQIAQMAAQLTSLSATQQRLEASNKALLEQVEVTELKGQDSEQTVLPHEARSHLQAGASQAEKLSKGFDYSIVEIAKALGRKVSPPEEMLDKQRLLFDLTLMMIRDYSRVKPTVIEYDTWIAEKEKKLRESTDEHVKTLEERLKATVLRLKEKGKRWTEVIGQLNKETDEVKRQNANLVDLLKEKTTEIEGLIQAKTALESSSQQSSIALSQEKDRLLEGLQQKITECNMLSKQNLQSQESISSLNTELSQLRSQIDQLNQQQSSSLKEKQDLSDEINRLHQQSELTSQQLSTAQASLSALQASSPEQARQLDEAQNAIQQLTQQKKEIDERIAKTEALLKDANAKIQQLNSQAEGMQKTIATLEEEKKAAIAAKNEGDEAKKVLEQRLAEGENKLQECDKEKAELKNRITELEKLLADMTKEKGLLEENHKTIETDRIRLQTANTDLEGQIQALKASALQMKADNENNISRLQQELTNKQHLSDQLQRDLEAYRNAVAGMCKEVAIHDSTVKEGDTAEQSCKTIIEVVKAQSEKLRLVREKWIMVREPLGNVLKLVLNSTNDLPEDLVEVGIEPLQSGITHINEELLPQLTARQSEIAEKTSRLLILIKEFSPSDPLQMDQYPSASLCDFFSWVIEKDTIFIAILEKNTDLAGSVPTVYDLSKQINMKFGVSIESATNQQLVTLSLTSEKHLRALLAAELDNMSAIKKLVTEATNPLQEEVEKLKQERDTEKNRADIEARLREKEAADHEIIKREAHLLKQQSQILEQSINDMKEKMSPADEPNPADEESHKLEALQQSFQASLDKVRNEAVKLRLIRIITKIMHPGISRCLQKWQAFAKSQTNTIYTNPAQYQDDSLKSVKLDLVKRNTILSVASNSSSTEKPMPEFALYRLASEIMLKRASTPVTGEADTLPKFTVVYLTEKSKSHEAAVKQLKQMIPTLWNFTDDKYYGVLLARLFQIKNPFSNSLVAFLIQANSEMQTLVQKRLDAKLAAGGKKSLAGPDPLTGGRIFLCDALSLIYDLKLDSDPNVCRRILNHLRDPDMEKTDYVTFIINHRLEWLELDTREFFTKIDRMGQGVTVPTLIEAFKSQLQLCVSEKKLREVFTAKVDRNRSGQVGAEEFGVYMDVKYYRLNAAHDNYSVDKNLLLCTLSDVFDMMVEGLVTNITEICATGSEEERVRALLNAWPGATDAEIRGCCTETRKTGTEGLLNLLVQKEIKGMFVRPFGKI